MNGASSGRKILITRNAMLTDEALLALKDLARVRVLPDDTETALLSEIEDTHTIIIGPRPFVTRPLIESATALRHIARVGVGLDNIDLPAATERGIFVTNTPEVTSDSVAEFTLSLLLALAKNIPRCDRAVKGGNWDERDDLLLDHVELNGKTHGIVGMGRIGRKVASRCKGFGMKVVYHKRTRDLEFEKLEQVEYVPFDTLLKTADTISLHLPLTRETLNLFNREQFLAMKRTALLINQARGKVVNEKALSQALQEGLIGGYATDVYDQEPPAPDCEWLRFKNVIATPHLAGSTRESRARSAGMILKDVALVMQGASPVNLANPDIKAP
ncbi:MAG: hydroxyacid dehydrogenase [Thermodesulfobacteriota bacterium]